MGNRLNAEIEVKEKNKIEPQNNNKRDFWLKWKYNIWPNDKMDQCKHLNNYAPTPSLTQQQTINDMLVNVGLGVE